MSCGKIDLGQHLLRQWLGAWQHQAITWTNVDSSSVVFCGIPLTTYFQRAYFQSFVSEFCLICAYFQINCKEIAIMNQIYVRNFHPLMEICWQNSAKSIMLDIFSSDNVAILQKVLIAWFQLMSQSCKMQADCMIPNIFFLNLMLQPWKTFVLLRYWFSKIGYLLASLLLVLGSALSKQWYLMLIVCPLVPLHDQISPYWPPEILFCVAPGAWTWHETKHNQSDNECVCHEDYDSCSLALLTH